MFGGRLSKFSTKNCPLCNSSQLRRSHRRTFERLLLPFTIACRCNECGHRFYTTARSTQQSSSSPFAMHSERQSLNLR